MQYWLMKSEPNVWSIDQQKKAGSKGVVWDGVRNYQAANNLKKMKKGDLCFFYHSNIGKEIVGIVEVIKEAYLDKTDKTGRFVAVTVKFIKKLKKPTRTGAQEGGLMDLGGMEKDYRQEGGFVPIGGQEKADDVPARLSKNEFVFTADAVRAAGGGDIDRGAEIMENLMDNLEAGGKVSEKSQGLEGARGMFANTQQLEKRII